MSGADAWGLFGSDSDDDSTVPAPPPKRPPPPPVRHAKKRRPWEVLIPTFEGALESSPGPVTDNDNATAAYKAPIADVAKKGSAPFSAPPVHQHPSVRFEAHMAHRGGGRGFVASADISPGTVLLVERRFLPMPSPTECGLAGGIGQEELCLKWILELPLSRLKEVLNELRWLHPQSLRDLHKDELTELIARREQTAKEMVVKLGKEVCVETGLDVRGVLRLFGALQSNGFASGVYLHPAMTNHSCRPNAVKWQGKRTPREGGRLRIGAEESTVAEEATSEIRATELIREGEEITISYLEPREIARSSRQKRLKEQFGFDCDCRLCCGSGGYAKPLEAFIDSGSKREDKGAMKPSLDDEGAGKPSLDDDAASEPAAKIEVSEQKVTVPDKAGTTGTEDATQMQVSGGNQDMPLPDTQMTEVSSSASLGDEKKQLDVEHLQFIESVEPEASADTAPDAAAGTKGTRKDEEDLEEDDLATKGLVTENVLERRLDAVESVITLARTNEVRWHGVLSEVLTFRRKAAEVLGSRHIALARADKVVSKACIAILQGSLDAAEADQECVQAVTTASSHLPTSFGGRRRSDSTAGGDALKGSFRTRLVAVLLSSLVSRRKTQLLYLGNMPHPEAGACLADLSQAMSLLLATGKEGEEWIYRLPGRDAFCDACNALGADMNDTGEQLEEKGKESNAAGNILENTSENACEGLSKRNDGDAACESCSGDGDWWSDGGMTGASLFERECDRAARRIGRIFEDHAPSKA